MSKIIEARNLPENEKVYLKKGILGYRIVYPIKSDDGKLNIVNLLVGGWQNFFKLILLIFAVLFFIYVYHHDTSEMQKVATNPCDYCSSKNMMNTLGVRYAKLENYTIINMLNISHSGVITNEEGAT